MILIPFLAWMLLGVEGDPASSQPNRPGPAGMVYAEPNISAIIDGLKSPVWRVREGACGSLTQLGPRVYPHLRDAFAKNRQYEVRRRIKNICREIYLFEKMGPSRAFLGISHNRQALRNTEDPRIPPGCTALLVTDIFTASAADRAGLRAGDLVVSLNGRVGTLQEPAIQFTEWIARQLPGAPCRIGVIRGGAAQIFDAQKTDWFRSEQFAKMKFEVVQTSQDARIPKGSAGIRIMDVRSVDPRLKLKTGDLIIALDDQLIPATDTKFHFLTWARRGARVLDEEVGEKKAPAGAAIQLKEKANAQILRGGERMELNAVLGRRPLYLLGYLRTQGPPPWPVGWETVDQAMSEFETWFSDSFDPGRTFEERAGEGSSWMPEPGQAGS